MLKSLGGLGYLLAYFEKLFFTATNPNTLGLEGLADNREGKEEGREICLPKQSHVWAPRNKQPSKTILPAEGRETRVGSCKAGGCDHTFPSRTVIREIQTGQISWALLGSPGHVLWLVLLPASLSLPPPPTDKELKWNKFGQQNNYRCSTSQYTPGSRAGHLISRVAERAGAKRLCSVACSPS